MSALQRIVCIAALASSLASPIRARAPSNDHPIQPLVEQYCFACHGTQTQTAGVNLAAMLDQRPLVRNRETWTRVIGALDVGKMPPVGAPQPSGAERDTLVAALTDAIDGFDYSTIDDPGFERMRRLTQREFDNTLRDLIGIDLRPAARFPAELAGASGFDNSANTLFLQSTLMERYIAAAERVIELALPDTPTTAEQRRARARILVAEPGPGTTERQAADVILRRFLRRAYRRPPAADEVARAAGQFQRALGSGHGFEASIKIVLQAVLVSPHFLLRVEAGRDGPHAFQISDWELASRLSYFLWASMPDDELFELADRGTLSDPDTMARQVDRMLADPRADTLGSVFAAQWLGYQHVGTRIWLDPIDNPWCTDSLMTAMRDESSMFFMSLLRDKQPIRRLIDANYTFVNAELATTLYGMEGVAGEQMRRVRLDNPDRGGILGHGSILALTSNYKDTSPVKRGHYVLDTLLGTPPPPPPPNAGVLDEQVADLRNKSFREKLEMHSGNETCRVCHSQIDPIGFGLENFDYFGRWRDSYDFRSRVETEAEANEVRVVDDTNVFAEMRYYKTIHTPIAAEGALPSGTTFTGPAGLKRALLGERHDDLVRQTVSKTLAYALGRQLEYYDEPAVRHIIAALEDDGFRFQTLLQAVVASYPFQYKKHRTRSRPADAPADLPAHGAPWTGRDTRRAIARCHAPGTRLCRAGPGGSDADHTAGLSLFPEWNRPRHMASERDRRRRGAREAQRMDEPARAVQGRPRHPATYLDTPGERSCGRDANLADRV